MTPLPGAGLVGRAGVRAASYSGVMAKIGKEDEPITVEPDAPFEAPAEPAPTTEPATQPITEPAPEPDQMPVPSPS